MRFKNYLNEKISTTKMEQTLNNHMSNIAYRFSELENPKNATTIIKQELKEAVKKILYKLYEIDRLNKVKARVYKKQKSKKCSGGANYYNVNSEGIGQFEFGVEIGEDVLNAAIYDKEEAQKVFHLISGIMVHEIVHLIQGYRSKGELRKSKSYYGDGKEMSYKPEDTEGYEIYLAYPEEISAYAAEAAVSLLNFRDVDNNKISPELLLNQLNKKSTLEEMSRISRVFSNYYEHFGKKNDNKLAQKVWKKFIKEFIFHVKERNVE